MIAKLLPTTAIALLLSLHGATSFAADERAQYPTLLARSYFDVGVGLIDYPFSQRQLEPGFQAQSIQVPHVAARLALFGYRFNEHLAVQLNYMRPVEWVGYTNVNGVEAKRTVWMNLAGPTLRATLPLAGRFSLSAEAGFALVTRRGFETDGVPVVKDANFWTPLVGGGLRYRLNRSWELQATAAYTPSHARSRQPHTLLVTGGFTHDMNPLSEAEVRRNSRAEVVFPRNLLQLGYSSDVSGFGVNRVVSVDVPIFWGGIAQVKEGVALHYERNVFHTRKVFSLDVGASVSYWRSRQERASFVSLSAFPVFRFTPLRFGGGDVYLSYSLAGPTSLSKVLIDGNDTGRHFTFQDFLALGAFLGKGRRMNAELRIAHYSNGNLFPKNAGVSIPLTFVVGYTFP